MLIGVNLNPKRFNMSDDGKRTWLCSVRTGEMQNRLEELTESDEALSTTKNCKIVGFGVCAQKTNILTPKRFMLFHVQLCTSIDVDVKNLPL